MMKQNYALSLRSLKNLEGVHPDLVMVVNRAIEITPYDFGVTCGTRDIDTQVKMLDEGKSTTMRSKHLPQADGFSHAVDLSCYVKGKITWDHKYFRKIIQAMMTAAIELGIQIKAGGLWRDFLDSPHFELDDRYYP